MTDHATDAPPAADDLWTRLNKIADHLIEARDLIEPLEASGFRALRTHANLMLMEVGRCIAREFGTPSAVRAVETPTYENCEA